MYSATCMNAAGTHVHVHVGPVQGKMCSTETIDQVRLSVYNMHNHLGISDNLSSVSVWPI